MYVTWMAVVTLQCQQQVYKTQSKYLSVCLSFLYVIKFQAEYQTNVNCQTILFLWNTLPVTSIADFHTQNIHIEKWCNTYKSAEKCKKQIILSNAKQVYEEHV
jgi:hypothetical protein